MTASKRNEKAVLVIGGTSGIGLETAKQFGKTRHVVIVGRNIGKISDEPGLAGTLRIPFDICDRENLDGLLDSLRDIDIDTIVHCAGIFRTKNRDDDGYRKAYRDTKLGGVELIRLLLKRRPGLVTHVCGVSSLYTFLPDRFAPMFEKEAQREFEEAVLSLKDVIVNCVAPGLVRTPLAEAAYGEEGMKKILSLAPGSRMLEPAEIAKVIVFLSSQDEVTGAVIPVDGDYLKFLIR